MIEKISKTQIFHGTNMLFTKITPQPLEEFLAHILQAAKDMLVKEKKLLTTAFLIKDNDMMMIENLRLTKTDFQNLVRSIVNRTKTEQVFVVSDGWMTSATTLEIPSLIQQGVEQHPNSRKVITVIAQDKETSLIKGVAYDILGGNVIFDEEIVIINPNWCSWDGIFKNETLH